MKYPRTLISLYSPINWLMKIAKNLEKFREKKLLLSSVLVYNVKNGKSVKAKALWDTGATNSCITQNLANRLGLEPSGEYNFTVAGGNVKVDAYEIELMLDFKSQNKHKLLVGTYTENPEFEVIVGMDCILKGELNLKTEGGELIFSFTEY